MSTCIAFEILCNSMFLNRFHKSEKLISELKNCISVRHRFIMSQEVSPVCNKNISKHNFEGSTGTTFVLNSYSRFFSVGTSRGDYRAPENA